MIRNSETGELSAPNPSGQLRGWYADKHARDGRQFRDGELPAAPKETEFMARYFFDSSDGSSEHRDKLGIDCPDDAAAKKHALVGLAELTRDRLPDAVAECVYGMRVRNAEGRQVFHLTLTLAFHSKPSEGELGF